jgi:hypothetical protein
MCEPMGRREIFLTFSLLVEIEGHFTNEFVSYVYETEDWITILGQEESYIKRSAMPIYKQTIACRWIYVQLCCNYVEIM